MSDQIFQMFGETMERNQAHLTTRKTPQCEERRRWKGEMEEAENWGGVMGGGKKENQKTLLREK